MRARRLKQAADLRQLVHGHVITKLMVMIWQSRLDLQQAFDLETEDGQYRFVQWYEASVFREYGLNPYSVNAFNASTGVNATTGLLISLHRKLLQSETRLARVFSFLPRPLYRISKRFWFGALAAIVRISTIKTRRALVRGESYSSSHQLETKKVGATLIGYVFAEIGMGEHVRMTASALATTPISYGVVNFNLGVQSRQRATLDGGDLTERADFFINLFHVNADQMLRAYCYLGAGFFEGCYNVGYWAWELEKCPDEWVPVLDMVDEVWAPSRFIQEAFQARTSIPVKYMPLCVSLPEFERKARAAFGLSTNRFLFLFVFDFLSYVARKNPYASIDAFKRAFPDRSTAVGLVIKVMHGDERSAGWAEMIHHINGDPRIVVLNITMNRADVLALIECCDCFLSLHRSEGFGRGIAEAMHLGKPVVATAYSGNMDFTKRDNSFLVNYQLVPVRDGEYVFYAGQYWAQVDLDHAAHCLRRVYFHQSDAKIVAARGQAFVHSNYSAKAIGRIYEQRIMDICKAING